MPYVWAEQLAKTEKTAECKYSFFHDDDFEKNENAQEYFGTRITTRNLYETVCSI